MTTLQRDETWQRLWVIRQKQFDKKDLRPVWHKLTVKLEQIKALQTAYLNASRVIEKQLLYAEDNASLLQCKSSTPTYILHL